MVCEGSSAVLHCPHDSVINIQSAFFGRKSNDICPHFEGSEGICGANPPFLFESDQICYYYCCFLGSCTVQGVFPQYRKQCDNRPFCFAYAHVEQDPCPTISKYLEIVYSCEQKGRFFFLLMVCVFWQMLTPGFLPVCLHGLGVEDGSIPDEQLSASSSIGSYTPSKARLNGDFCWKPSGSGTHAPKKAHLLSYLGQKNTKLYVCPAATSSWIQVNLGQTRKVTGIVIQGCSDGENWITKYKLQHSIDGISWKDYTADGDVSFKKLIVKAQNNSIFEMCVLL